MPSRMDRPRKRIAVLIETDDSWGREVVRSIASYAQQENWALLIGPRDQQRRLRLPGVWKGDGVLASLRDQGMVRHLRQSGLPAVDVSNMMPQETWLGRVVTDDDARARMVFDHFRSRHLTHFAGYAPPLGRYSPQRMVAFRQIVEQAGMDCSIYDAMNERTGWEDDHRRVLKWLKRLPRPLAVFAADPYSARQLVEICQWEGIRIPDDVAVLAGDTDELLCNIAWPRLSSLELDCYQIGQQACRMLSGFLAGEPVPTSPLLLPPLHVIPRHSTETLAIDDPDVAEVLRYIRLHATEGIRVSDLLRVFPVSRRTLELRFRELLQRTPAEEIRRTRLLRARDLLLHSDLTVDAVARASGIGSGAQLASDFRKHFGIRPSELRGERRARP